MQVLEVERAAVKRISWLIKRISICKKQTVMQIEATFRKFSRYLFSALEQQPDYLFLFDAFSALTLLVGRQEGHPACKKLEWWGAGMVICLERDADLHTA